MEYTFDAVREPVDFILRPFVGMRDFHTLQRSDAPLVCRIADNAVLIQNGAFGDCELRLSCSPLDFVNDPQWWFNFIYRANQGRGISHTEDLWAPGFFKGHIELPTRIVILGPLGRLRRARTDDGMSMPRPSRRTWPRTRSG